MKIGSTDDLSLQEDGVGVTCCRYTQLGVRTRMEFASTSTAAAKVVADTSGDLWKKS